MSPFELTGNVTNDHLAPKTREVAKHLSLGRIDWFGENEHGQPRPESAPHIETITIVSLRGGEVEEVLPPKKIGQNFFLDQPS